MLVKEASELLIEPMRLKVKITCKLYYFEIWEFFHKIVTKNYQIPDYQNVCHNP